MKNLPLILFLTCVIVASVFAGEKPNAFPVDHKRPGKAATKQGASRSIGRADAATPVKVAPGNPTNMLKRATQFAPPDTTAANLAQYITYPDSMTFRPFPIYRDQSGVYHANATVKGMRDALETKGVAYYIGPNGNNANNGLSPASPKKTVAGVMSANLGSTSVIYVAPGLYRQDVLNVVKAASDTANIVLIGSGTDNTFITGGNSVAEVWTATGSGGYSSPITNVDRVLDAKFLNAYSFFTELKYVSTADSVNLVPGTVFYNSTTVYVHTKDNRAPDANILVLKSLGNIYSANGGSLYAEGIAFIGGRRALQVYSNPSAGISKVDAYFYNCQFLYGAAGEGLWTYNIRRTWSENCVAAFNRSDGFNYKSVNNPLAQTVVEINDQSFWNGYYQNKFQPPYIANASSAHSSIDVVRINCIGFNNGGPNFIDVSAVASDAPFGKKHYILNAGVTAYASMGRYSPSDSNSGNADFQAGSLNGRTITYLYGCSSRSDSSFKTKPGSTMYVDALTKYGGTSIGNIIFGTAPGNAGLTVERQLYPLTNTLKPQAIASFAINATTTALSSATLNTTYPTAPVGFMVICGNISAGGAIYTKYATGIWVKTTAPVAP